jgi:CheY-like chemotaxis protein
MIMHQRRFHILVADDNTAALQHAVNRLKRGDHVVAGTSSPDDAGWWLTGWPVDLVITTPRFGDITGVELIRRARAAQGAVAGLIMDPAQNAASAEEARRNDVHLASTALDSAEFAGEVAGILAGITHRQRWPRKELSPTLSMHVGAASGRLMDVSYGGLKFELADEPPVLRSPVELDVPRADLRVPVAVVWSARGQGRASVFGASITAEPAYAAEWRAFVDRVS